MVKYFVIICFSVIPFWGSCQAPESLNPDIFYKKFKTAASPVLIDLRDQKSFERAHLKNAVNIDYDEEDFEETFKSIVPKNRQIFVYCFTGDVSEEAGYFLEDIGYKDVIVLHGGFSAWTSSSKPYVSGLANTEPIAAFTVRDMENIIRHNQNILVFLQTPTCVYCKKMDPMIKKLTSEKSLKLQKIDIAKNQNIAEFYETNETPTFILYKAGKQIWKSKGDLTEAEFKLALKRSGM